MCLRFVFPLITRMTSWLRLSRRKESWKSAEILLLRHQLAVLQRQQPRRPNLDWADRALLATLLAVIPRARRHGLRLLITPDTIVRWHRDIVRRRWAARSIRSKNGRPTTRRNIRALALRLARENPGWGYQHIIRRCRAVIKLGPGALQSWASDIIAILREAHQAVQDARARGSTALGADLLDKLRQRYDQAAAFGVIHNRLRDWHEGNHPGYALGCWLRDYKEQVFLFTRDFAADWTTNIAERGAKAAKRYQAVSGYWHKSRDPDLCQYAEAVVMPHCSGKPVAERVLHGF
jgi:hypothetical protein